MNDSNAPEYFHLEPGGALPDFPGGSPVRVLVIARQPTEAAWKFEVCKRLYAAGSRYLSAWGEDSSAWDDEADDANLEVFDYGEIPDDRLQMSSWHAKEPLSEAAWFVRYTARHPDVELERTFLVDVGPANRRAEVLALWDGLQA